ncbi:SRPBCC family protein [Leptospira sp. FAT2]|uniref:SRPBCC family protein n=1 Tax=Leptospira sanjuanensis TaxID=2879643 RepID=UPI001EE7F0EA|nr:SRPBCC family protein [Leptospira sanjuanensis]MCG6167674.1 SRPBCC family protein [Leptospira sanjuanensis]MCG6193090.1 SRPBCC family protein [Leptospira sanjuanensis]
MKTTFETKHVSISVGVSWKTAYEFLSEPKNFPEWASGLCKSIRPGPNEEWIIEAPQGTLKAIFTPKNPYGILDHTVILNETDRIANPLRILPNGEGSEILFTLFKTPNMTQEKFEEDAAWVKKDLNELKALLERKY